jgi:hypothetical protein
VFSPSDHLYSGLDGQQPEVNQSENEQEGPEQAPTSQLGLAAKAAQLYETIHNQSGRQSHTFLGDMLQDYLDPALQDWDAILDDIRLPTHLAPEREECPITPGLF